MGCGVVCAKVRSLSTRITGRENWERQLTTHLGRSLQVVVRAGSGQHADLRRSSVVDLATLGRSPGASQGYDPVLAERLPARIAMRLTRHYLLVNLVNSFEAPEAQR
jgi:hypothetical protein